MAFPIDVADLLRSTKRIGAEREKPLHVVAVLDPQAPDDLIDAVTRHVVPSTAHAFVQVEVADQAARIVLPDTTDAVIAVSVSGATALSGVLAEARRRAIPALVLCMGGDAATLAQAIGHPAVDCRAVTDADAVPGELAGWLIERVSGKRLALAHNFEFVRRAVAEEAVKATALQNGLIGAAVIIPGADMPLITLNQGKMLLQVAAAYGQPLGMERAKELAAVVGGGFALRAVARQLAGAVPGLGWAVKGAVGYGGTLAMGKAAIAHFERGADLSEVLTQLVAVRDTAVHKMRESHSALASATRRLEDANSAAETDDRSAR